MCLLISFLLGVLVCNVIEARIEETVNIRIDDTDFSVSKTEMKNILAAADLEGHGFERDEITKTTKDIHGKEVSSHALFYFKVTNCSEASQTITELENLLPDAMTPALVTRLKSDLNAKNTADRLCRVGITTDAEDSPQNVRSVRSVRRPKRAFRLRVRVRVDIGCCRK